MIPSVIHRGSSTTEMLSSALTSAARGLRKKASSMSGISSFSTTPLAKSAPATPTRHMQCSGPKSVGTTSSWNNNIGAGYAEPLSPPQRSSFAGSPEDSGVSQGERSEAECGAVGTSTPAASPPSLVRSGTCVSDGSVDMRSCMDSPGTPRPLKPRSWSCDDNGFLQSSAGSSLAGSEVQGGEVRQGQGGAEVFNGDRKGNGGVPVVYVNGGEPLQLLAYQYKNLTMLMLLPSLPLIASAASGLIRDQLLDKGKADDLKVERGCGCDVEPKIPACLASFVRSVREHPELLLGVPHGSTTVSSVTAVRKAYQVLGWPVAVAPLGDDVAVAPLGDDVADLLKTVHRGWVLRSSPGIIVMFPWRVKSQLGAMKDRVDGQVGGHLNGEGRSFGCIPSGCHDRPRPHPFREELARDILFKPEFRGGNPNEIIGAEWARKTLAIGLLAHALLCLGHLVACLDK
ncbi:hypothetical protein CBR_g31093 [Chara braunii]|uniref:Uncharacterized protein n=1 Tax=Chara braunii TaxID=69332 RepID=A0A388LEI7_CHABU|nr:hypothetical protein CBR_g31093 [Chara braunii]|eukprot:GBG80633.1 hypothetical protein CBR_g31093 [Chara braunii]